MKVLQGSMALRCASTAVIPGLLLALAGGAEAAPITNSGTGLLNIGNGSVMVRGNGTTSGCIDFYNTTAPASCQPDGTTGSVTVNSPSTTPFTAGQTGLITDLNFDTLFPVVDFITIGPGGSIAHFDLAGLRVNTGANIGNCSSTPDGLGNTDTSAGVTCTPANSPFQITNGLADGSGNVNTVSITLTFDAWGYTGTSGTNYDAANHYVGVITTQEALAGNIDSILQQIAAGGVINASWSASMAPQTATPEPMTFSLLGGGLLLAAFARKRLRKA